jgi:DNA-binding transcriptional regulator LsrR (DeoR family)
MGKGRKGGDKNTITVKKSLDVAHKILEEGKTVQQCAKELGIHRNTVSNLFSQAMNQEEVKSRISRSRDRLVKMLSLADAAYLRTLKYNKPENFANQVNVATRIYRTFGLIQDQPQIQINNQFAVKIEVRDSTYEFTPPATEDE